MNLLDGFLAVLQLQTFGFVLLGVVLGIVVGAIPGLTGTMLIALSLPLSFRMASNDALAMFVAMYVGSVTGGLISAILLRMPGSPASVMTTFDGHPMAAAGRPGRALALGIGSSFFGSLVSGAFLIVLAPPLARFAAYFGPWEYFTMVLMALVLIAALSKGSLAKGLFSGFLGMLVAMPGLDPSDGRPRLTFGFEHLNDGLKLLPVLLGIFVVSTILKSALEIHQTPTRIELDERFPMMRLRDYRRHGVNLARSSLIGTWIGLLPGIGASVGSMIAYTVARTFSRTPQRFGTGCEEGIVASEAANNATVGGALIPLLAMGIPGSTVDAILIGALVIHGLEPGPLLFVNHPDTAWLMVATFFVATFLMFGLMTGAVGAIARIVEVPRGYILPAILCATVIGALAFDGQLFDVWVALVFGLVGFTLERAGVPLGPFVIGFVLAPIAEQQLRSGMMASDGSLLPLVTRPLPVLFLVVSLALILLPFVQGWLPGRHAEPRPGA